MKITASKYRKMIPYVVIAILLILGLVVTASLGESKKPSKNPEIKEVEDMPSGETTGELFGIVKDKNTNVNVVTILNLEDSKEYILSFNGGTDIRDKYNEVKSITQILVGEVVEVKYDIDKSKLISMYVSNKAWEYKNVQNFKINTADASMKVGNTLYQLGSNLVIANGDKVQTLIDIHAKDELILKGIDQTIYSVIVQKGHGYVRFTNYSDFIGGVVEVGYDVIMDVAEDMLIVVREGEYKVTLENGTLKGIKQVAVIRDKETVIDMSEYKSEPKQVSNVTFDIDPEGAVLFINGKETLYDDYIELAYGTYDMKVTLGGYQSYTGKLDVEESSVTVPIVLAEQKIVSGDDGNTSGNTSGEGNDKPEDNNNDNNNDSSNNSGGEEKPVVDKDHKIYIEKPEGAQVYLNGNLQGVAPCSFEKQIGTHTITFRQDGYETKSYMVEITNNGEDVRVGFPDMIRVN